MIRTIIGCTVFLFCLSANATMYTQTTANGLHIAVMDDSNNLTWDEARSFAMTAFETDLASIHSTQQQDEIYSALESLGGSTLGEQAWLGGRRESTVDGDFYWVDGTSWNPGAIEWGAGQPSGPDQEGLAMLLSGPDAGLLNDADINDSFSFFVMNAPTVVPVPAAAWLFGSALIGLVSTKRKK